MSDTTPTPAVSDAPQVDMNKYNPAFAPLFDILKSQADAANAQASRIKAATSDQSEAVNAVLSTNSDDEKIVKWREWDAKIREQIAAAQAKLDEGRESITEHAKSLIPGVDSSFNVEEEQKKFAGLRAEATQSRKALLMFLNNDNEAFAAGVAKHGIIETVSLRGNSAGTSKGSTDIKRPRIDAATVDGVSVADDKGKVSFTLLTQHLNKNVGSVDGDTVRDAAFEAAGTKDLSTLPAGTDVKFTLSIAGKDGKSANHDVVVTTKGRAATDDAPAGTNDDAPEDAATSGE